MGLIRVNGPAMRVACPDADGGEAAERVALRALPGFPQVFRRAARDIASAYRSNFVLARLVNDRGRFALALLILRLHVRGEAGGPALTSSALKAEASALGVCSPGRAGAVLAAFRLMGLVASVPDVDRRRRRLVATEKLIGLHLDRWRSLLESLAQIAPEGAAGLARLDQPAFLPPFVEELLEPFLAGWRIIDDIPALAVFCDRDSGVVIAFALLETAFGAPAASIAGLARTFRVSRSHVLDVMQDAEHAGLVRRIDARGGIRAEPALVEALEALVATALVRQARAVRRVLRETA